MAAWVAPVVAGAVSLISKYAAKKSKSKNERVPAALGRKDVQGVGREYRNLVSDYLGSEPGLSGAEGDALKRQRSQAIRGSYKGGQMQVRANAARQGLRGAAVGSNITKLESGKVSAEADAIFQQILAQHTIRESDITRRAAVAAGFLWPAESARGAGSISSVTQNNPNAWLDAIGAGTRVYGALANSGSTTPTPTPTPSVTSTTSPSRAMFGSPGAYSPVGKAPAKYSPAHGPR